MHKHFKSDVKTKDNWTVFNKENEEFHVYTVDKLYIKYILAHNLFAFVLSFLYCLFSLHVKMLLEQLDFGIVTFDDYIYFHIV